MVSEIATCISFPKSGRTWLRLMLDELNVPVRFSHHGTGNDASSFGRHIDELTIDPLSESDGKLVFLHRHPADVAVSFFYECTRRKK